MLKPYGQRRTPGGASSVGVITLTTGIRSCGSWATTTTSGRGHRNSISGSRARPGPQDFIEPVERELATDPETVSET